MDMMKIHRHINQMGDRDLELLKRLVAQPSVSARGQGVRECAELLCKLLRELGCSTIAVFETKGHPVVYGALESKIQDVATVLFYGHYDTQPPDPLDEWITPPFEPAVRDGRLYGCGVADNKGQFLAHILAVRSFLAVRGDIPINVKFVLDGEEESGSPNMPVFVEEHRELLKADLVYSSDGPMSPGGVPEIKLGYRGVVSLELELTAAEHQNHSKVGGLILNPVTELAQLIATMIDRTGRVLIEGFYDSVLPPTEYEKKLLDEYDFNPGALAEIYGVKRLKVETREDYYRQLMFLPTLTVNGMQGGYCGAGHKTCVPRAALVKLDIRLVKDMDPHDIAKKVCHHITAFNPDIKVRAEEGIWPSKTDAELPVCKRVIEAVKIFYPDAIIHPSSGGTLPDYVWTKILGLPSIGVPYGNADQKNHAPNENLRLDCFNRGVHVSAEVIGRIAEMGLKTISTIQEGR